MKHDRAAEPTPPVCRCAKCGSMLTARAYGAVVVVEPCTKCEDDAENRASEREYWAGFGENI